jgi:hypothetical protein
MTASTTSTTGIKLSYTLRERISPPREIRDMSGKAATTARREWIAAKIAEIESKPGVTTKVVGKGSYETIHVYDVIETEGRLRHRGHCQVCGNAQVTEEDRRNVLVLHGYQRPGYGYTVGRCPGVAKQPLELSQTITEQALANAQGALVQAQTAHAAAITAAAAATEALFGGIDGRRTEREEGAVRAEPRRPSEPDRYTRAADRASYPERLAIYQQLRAEWEARFPLHAAWENTREATSRASHAEWQIKQERDHFQFLLDRKYLGKPLIEEVVA